MAVSDAGGLAHCDLGALNLALHRNINSSREYQPPIELAEMITRLSLDLR